MGAGARAPIGKKELLIVNATPAAPWHTLIPPLWHRLMTPKVLAWARSFASDEERTLAVAANARSGIRELAAANREADAAPTGDATDVPAT